MINKRETGVSHRALGPVMALGLMMALSGCLGEGAGGEFGFFSDKTVSQAAGGAGSARAKPQKPKVTPLRQAELAGGKVVVQGPRGYCVDPATLRRGFAGGFALIASCNSLTGEFSGADVEPVVMTVQVQSGLARKEAPTASAMASALAPERALERVDGDALSLVHMAGGGDKGLPTSDPKYWRGAMVINGYLVGLAVYAPKGSALAGKGGKRLIVDLAENLREASPTKMYLPPEKATRPVKQ
ncbi:hypothetical protein LZG00_13035 [Rhodobacteraceae bacterium LMO-12]|nr:hypothetical protein [Rhodobacteraceae bacterium LMO-JJ12]